MAPDEFESHSLGTISDVRDEGFAVSATPGWPVRRIAALALIVLGAAIIAVATLTPSGDDQIPAQFCLVCGELGGVDVVLNILLYLPLGFGLGLWGARRWAAAIGMCAASIVIELLQLSVIPGRDGSIGDVVTNALGGLIGLLLAAHIERLVAPKRGAALLAVVSSAGWFILQAVVGFAMRPAPTVSRYYGQYARPLGREAAFPGRVLSASFGSQRIPDWRFPHEPMHDLIARTGGGRLDVTATSGGAVPRFAPILRVMDEEHAEIIMIGATGSDLVYRLRAGSAAIRVRPMAFRLRDVFARPIGSGARQADTTRLQAVYATDVLRLSAASSGAMRSRTLRISAADGWRLLAPWDTYYDGTRSDELRGALWLMALLLPAGYWTEWFRSSARANAPGPSRRFVLGLVVVAIGAGIVVGPLAFGLSSPTIIELAGVCAGIAVGACAAFSVGRALSTWHVADAGSTSS